MPRPDHKDLMRFSTAGSVDDGKSTLIGRLLYESAGVLEDQLASVRRASMRSSEGLDFSLITDGLRAEREQSITIDVAYRYFSTARRKFIIVDSPGHEQYTRNMVTGASRVDLAVILVDVRKGVLEQTRRHTYIAWLLGVRRVVVAVNKMDLVEYDQEAFLSVCDAYGKCSASLHGLEVHFVPVSALKGDNVVQHASRMSWYEGSPLLELLELIPLAREDGLSDFRFPVQMIIRPHQDYRGYAGQVVSGVVRPGEEVVAVLSGQQSRIKGIQIHSNSLAQAFPPLSVVLTLSKDLELGRGDMLAHPGRSPSPAKRISANLIWMSRNPLRLNDPYLVKHTTQMLCGVVTRIFHAIDIRSFEKIEASALNANEIAVIELETNKPMLCDPFDANRATGSFILIDPKDNATAAAGMVLGDSISFGQEAAFDKGNSTASSEGALGRHIGLTVWCTGLSGSGKSTICSVVNTELLARGFRVEMLDGDVLRKQLNSDLGFTKRDRDENVRRIGFLAQLLSRNGVIVLVSAISPYREIRDEVRRMNGRFVEVYVNAPLDVCERRDPKGLYKRARAGEISRLTGIDDPYEPPLSPEIRCDTHLESVKLSAEKVIKHVLDLFSPIQFS